MNVFGQQAVSIAVSERVDKQVASLLAAAEPPPSVDQPEPAGEERRFGHAEVILVRVTHHVVAAQKLALDRFDGPHEARVGGLDQPSLGQEQHARIENIEVKASGESLARIAPRLLEQSVLNPGCLVSPLACAFGKPEMRSDCREP